MSAKKEYLILFLIIIGAALYLYFNRADRLHYRLPELAAVDRADIVGIKIERSGSEALSLEREEGRWLILPAGYAADTGAVDDILAAVTGLRLTTLVSESEKYRRYELDPEQALAVSALGADGSVLRRFRIGKNAPVQGHAFVMTADDPRVYQARGRLRQVFDKTVESLRDKTVLSFVAEEIRKIDITAGEATLSLVKQASAGEAESGDDMVWVEASSLDPADQAVVKALLSGLSSLECRSFIAEVDRESLTEPLYNVTFTGDQPHTLSLFPSDDPESDGYWGVSSQQDDVFALPSYTIERLMKKPDELMTERETG